MSRPTPTPRVARVSRAQLIRPVVVLVAICVVAGVLLGVVHAVTEPVAAQVAEERAQLTYRALMPEAADFTPLACDVPGVTALLDAKDADGRTIGHVVVASSKGYSGQVPLAIAFDAAGTVTAVTAMANGETPGLGTRVAEPQFVDQFVGRAAEPLQVTDIDVITGATISSKAALGAFNAATQAIRGLADDGAADGPGAAGASDADEPGQATTEGEA
ncbi:FMN-binding protein [bacterium]|nr:FMN-binding protein [bacterium]